MADQATTTAGDVPADVAAAVAALVTVTAWGSAFVGIRAAGDTFSPGALALGRVLVGSAVLSTIAMLRRDPLPQRRDLLAIARSPSAAPP